MRRVPLVLLLAACGGRASPGSTQPQPAAPRESTVAAVTCAEAGIILRGPIEDTVGAGAGPEREQAIAEACARTRWSPQVLECIGSRGGDAVMQCLATLTAAQTEAYEQAIEMWADSHQAWDRPGSDVGPSPDLACDAVIGSPAHYPPTLADDAPERAWLLERRGHAIEHACEHSWGEPLKRCLEPADSADEVHACLAEELDTPDRDALRDELTELDRLAARITAARTKPGTIGCKQVVAVHYGDANWRTRLDGFKANERKRMIAESRAKMTRACTADAWDETLRACIVVSGDQTCFEAAGMALSWGYPAAGVSFSLGIPECDAYAAVIQRLVQCDRLPADSRDAVRDGFDQLRATLAGLPVADRAKLAPSCAAGADAVTQSLQIAGC